VFSQLTKREQQIAQKVLLGQQNKMIADLLYITERTVKAHLSTIFKKLGVRNRLELTLKLQQANRRNIT
jgi:DNA-binding NarL/FixJ family response regulator